MKLDLYSISPCFIKAKEYCISMQNTAVIFIYLLNINF